MNIKYQNSERGQAIVFLVVGLVVFLGFVALAIDGGMALADRRHSQNGADAASLAGGGEAALDLENHQYIACDGSWSCNNEIVGEARGIAVNTAISRASKNNFSIDTDMSDSNGVTTSCYAGGVGKNYIDVTVDVSTVTRSNFAQLLFPGALRNEVEAVTRIHPRGPMGFGNAIVALNPQDCGGKNGGVMYGNGDTEVWGGGIFSNGCISGNGNAGSVTVHDGSVEGHYISKGNLTWNPEPVYTEDQIDPSDYGINSPDCVNNDPNHNITGNDLEKALSKSATYELDSGLWCITGDLTINQNVSNPSLVILRAHGVTIVMLDGKLTINGPANVQLHAPESLDPDDKLVSPAERGLLIYLPETNSNTVTLNGNEGAEFSGLVFAPNSTISMNGTGFNTYKNSQIIGWNVEIGGNANTNVTYNACEGYTKPTWIELNK